MSNYLNGIQFLVTMFGVVSQSPGQIDAAWQQKMIFILVEILHRVWSPESLQARSTSIVLIIIFHFDLFRYEPASGVQILGTVLRSIFECSLFNGCLHHFAERRLPPGQIHFRQSHSLVEQHHHHLFSVRLRSSTEQAENAQDLFSSLVKIKHHWQFHGIRQIGDGDVFPVDKLMSHHPGTIHNSGPSSATLLSVYI